MSNVTKKDAMGIEHKGGFHGAQHKSPGKMGKRMRQLRALERTESRIRKIDGLREPYATPAALKRSMLITQRDVLLAKLGGFSGRKIRVKSEDYD